MEKQETHAPYHDENQKTHTPATMPCACIGYGEPLPRLPINTGRKDKKKEEKFFGEQREASCRNGEEKGRKKERAGEDGQAAETKKRGNQRLQNFGEGEKGSDREGSKTREGRKE
jgi:hypothetical protein